MPHEIQNYALTLYAPVNIDASGAIPTESADGEPYICVLIMDDGDYLLTQDAVHYLQDTGLLPWELAELKDFGNRRSRAPAALRQVGPVSDKGGWFAGLRAKPSNAKDPEYLGTNYFSHVWQMPDGTIAGISANDADRAYYLELRKNERIDRKAWEDYFARNILPIEEYQEQITPQIPEPEIFRCGTYICRQEGDTIVFPRAMMNFWVSIANEDGSVTLHTLCELITQDVHENAQLTVTQEREEDNANCMRISFKRSAEPEAHMAIVRKWLEIAQAPEQKGAGTITRN